MSDAFDAYDGLYLYGFVRAWWSKSVPAWFHRDGHWVIGVPGSVPFTGLTFPA